MTKLVVVGAAIIAPSIGPAVLIIAGVKLPVAALFLSMVGLLLARFVKPRSASHLSKAQEWALTGLLALLLVVIVAGEFPFLGDGEPLGVGMATAWGVGLGTSGMLFVDLIGTRIMAGARAAFGMPQEDDDGRA